MSSTISTKPSSGGKCPVLLGRDSTGAASDIKSRFADSYRSTAAALSRSALPIVAGACAAAAVGGLVYYFLYRIPESGIGESDAAYEAAKRRDETEWRRRLIASGAIDGASAEALLRDEEEQQKKQKQGTTSVAGASTSIGKAAASKVAPTTLVAPPPPPPSVSLSAAAHAALGALGDFSPPLGVLKKSLRRHDEIEKEFLKEFATELAAGETTAARKRAVKLQEFLTRAFIDLDGTKVTNDVERAARKATLAALHGLSDRIRAQTPAAEDQVIGLA